MSSKDELFGDLRNRKRVNVKYSRSQKETTEERDARNATNMLRSTLEEMQHNREQGSEALNTLTGSSSTIQDTKEEFKVHRDTTVEASVQIKKLREESIVQARIIGFGLFVFLLTVLFILSRRLRLLGGVYYLYNISLS